MPKYVVDSDLPHTENLLFGYRGERENMLSSVSALYRALVEADASFARMDELLATKGAFRTLSGYHAGKFSAVSGGFVSLRAKVKEMIEIIQVMEKSYGKEQLFPGVPK